MTASAQAFSRLGAAAIGYAQRGWHVFPLQPRGKHPLIKGGGGFLAATCDVEQVRAWWTQHPGANIGLWPGQSGLVILDLDGPEGAAAAEQLGALAVPTLVCTTGREDGGRHLYFRRPEFPVSNCDLAPKLEVRGDAGYVILPPSIHPTGRLYTWAAKVEPAVLPDTVRAALEAVQERGAAGSVGREPSPTQRAAREVIFEPIGAGGRNNALTRYAGRLLAKGIPHDEALLLVHAVNQAQCDPPLPRHEVNVLVANIATREGHKRRTVGEGRTIGLVDDAATSAPASPAELRRQQIEGAKQLLRRDTTDAPRWGFTDLDALTGPMLDGDLIVVGSRMGNGKSTLLMSQMDAFARAKTGTLYIPLEVDPEVCRLRWAAWKLGLEQKHVIRRAWRHLPEGSEEAVELVIEEQDANPFIHFVPDKRLTFAKILHWCRWGRDEAGCRVVMLDHFHRLDFGPDARNFRITATEVVRQLKDLARELGMVVMAAAQLNSSPDPLDMFLPPQAGRLKETSGIGEEADVILMLARRLRRDLPDKWERKLRLGQINERDISEPGTMQVTCRKHRLDDDALNRCALLQVVNGKVQDKARSWQVDHSWLDAPRERDDDGEPF